MMETLFSGIQAWIEATGAWAYVIALAVMAIVAILPIPAEAPAIMNGMLFGPVVGTAISWMGAMVGAWISFELARSVGRPVAHRFVSASALAKADEIAQGAGWWGLLVAR
jgi:uncharacterized membrane protein YdjX (TVP38/TMEM64 family)